MAPRTPPERRPDRGLRPSKLKGDSSIMPVMVLGAVEVPPK
jgi:hypothetical protein